VSGKEVTTWPDPNITIGVYRILPRTDGTYAVFDDRNPVGFMTASVKKTKEAAAEEAKRLVSIGSPQVFFNEKTGKQRRAPDKPLYVVPPPPDDLGLDASDGGDRKATSAGLRTSIGEPSSYVDKPKRAARRGGTP
jgi:hypothetical protein